MLVGVILLFFRTGLLSESSSVVLKSFCEQWGIDLSYRKDLLALKTAIMNFKAIML